MKEEINESTHLFLIIGYMYFFDAELVFEHDGREGAYHLFFDRMPHYHGQLLWKQCDLLIELEIVELDSGSDEAYCGTKSYVLTRDSIKKIEKSIKACRQSK